MHRRRLIALATLGLAAPLLAGSAPAQAAQVTGTIHAGNSVGSVTAERFVNGGCTTIDPNFQGIDGWIIAIPPGTTKVMVSTSSPVSGTWPLGGYDIWFYDTCPTLPGRATVPGYFGYKAGSGTLSVTLPKPAKFGVVHLGTGAEMKFTYTTSI
jgi:hypothetical protein